MKRAILIPILSISLIGAIVVGSYYSFKTGRIEAFFEQKNVAGEHNWSFGEKWYSPRLETGERKIFNTSGFKLTNTSDISLMIHQYPANLSNSSVKVEYFLVKNNGDIIQKYQIDGLYEKNKEAKIAFQSITSGTYKIEAETVGALDACGDGKVQINN